MTGKSFRNKLMLNYETSLGYFLLAILFGFALLLYFLLRVRREQQLEDLQLQPEIVWNTLSNEAQKMNLTQEDMLFGVYQDVTSHEISLVVKDGKNQIVGRVNSKTLSRERKLTSGNQNFIIQYPVTWKQSAILRSVDDGSILASYLKTGWLGEHQVEVPGYGVIKSKRPSIDFKVIFDYNKDGRPIGTSRKISASREKGRVLVLPEDLPLAVKIFILAV